MHFLAVLISVVTHYRIALGLGLGLAGAAWFFRRNGPLRERRMRSLISLGLTAAVLIVGWILWLRFRELAAGIFVCVMLGGSIAWLFSRQFDQSIDGSLGGLMFDMVFSEGPFSEPARQRVKLPSVVLLRHWRDHGRVRQAYRTARRHLAAVPEAFPVWMFAAETLVTHFHNVSAAAKVVRRLNACRVFDDNQKSYAVQQLEEWKTQAKERLEHDQMASGDDLGTRIPEGMWSRFLSRFWLREAAPARPDFPAEKLDAAAVAAANASGVETVLDLLEAGRMGAAAEALEQRIRQEPDDFDALLLLARVHGQGCGMLNGAEKLVARIEASEVFTDEQKSRARAQLQSWREAGSEAPFLVNT